MDEEKVILSGQTIQLSESEDKTYLELTNRVCYYDDQNLNGVLLPSEGALEKAKTLVHQPVVAKYTTDDIGNPTFKGHEVYIDSEGDVCFATDIVGTHTDVEIKEDQVNVNGTIKNLPCLFATYRIPKRNKNVIAAVKRLYNNNFLHSSWELMTKAYKFENNIKTITDYEFIGNCLLGTVLTDNGWENYPAYGTDAKAISLSSKQNQLLIAEALVKDLNENVSQGKEDDSLKEKNNDNPEENIETQTSSLTQRDLRNKIEETLQKKIGHYVWIEFWFPLENKAWYKSYEDHADMLELDYMQIFYEIENEEITNLSEPQKITLNVSISELMKVGEKLEDLEKNMAEKDDLLVKTSTMIASLNDTIETLKPFKEAFDKAQAEKMEAEEKEKQNKLKSKALATKLFEEKEFIESEELKTIISEIDEVKLNSIIVERLAKSLETQTSSVETSEVKKEEKFTSNLNDDDGATTNKGSLFFKAVISN